MPIFGKSYEGATHMGLPKQVQKQLQEVEEMERALTPAPVEEAATTKTEPEAQPTQTAEPIQKVDEVKPETPPAPQVEQWEQRYRTLKGIFDTEVPKLQAQNKDLARQIAEIKAAQVAAPVTPNDPLVTDKDVQSFGEDLIDVQRRVAREVMRDLVAPLESKLQERDVKISRLEAMLGKTSGQVTTLSFEQRLEQAIPGFSQMNSSDPKWADWLDEVDTLTGRPRRDYAEYAYSQNDVGSISRIVDLFRKSAQQPEPPRNSTRTTELERQVAPRRSASAASPVPPGERVYTEVEADRLWNKVRELYSAGKNDEAANIENELTFAYASGRVRA